MKPRCEFANSAGSSFCLPRPDAESGWKIHRIRQSRRRTGHGESDCRRAAGRQASRPAGKAPVIKKATVMAVTPERNPYAGLLNMTKAK